MGIEAGKAKEAERNGGNKVKEGGSKGKSEGGGGLWKVRGRMERRQGVDGWRETCDGRQRET